MNHSTSGRLPGPLSSATGPAPAAVALSSAEAGLTHAEVADAVARATEVVTPHHLLLAWAGSSAAEPRESPFSERTALLAALPPRHAEELAAAAWPVVETGGRVHCARSCEPGTVVDELRATRATDLVVRGDLLCPIRRTLERELATGPIVTLAVFEGLQRDRDRGAEARRAALPALHAWLGSKLTTLWYAGEPADAETVTFFTRVGLPVRRLG
ncbi:hypothetical protein [Amycolatopsis sp. NPDC021455]|uniref:hypothetical protein n=1 Tax=Amycolatopsis sp. NPDC021455 TaxID=3154901 RepID=UPI0033FFF2CF